jgi:hypothetical protein
MASDRKRVGDEIKAGELLLFTAGAYSSYGIVGLYRAKRDFTILGRQIRHGSHIELEPNQETMSADPSLLEEVDYSEIWKDD